MKVFIMLGSVNAFISVALGAFGAHGLRDKVTPELLLRWEKAVDYQLYHALALLIIALCIKLWPDVRRVRTAGLLLFMGIMLFSGSLYALVLTGIRPLGMITPVGAIAFLCGWLLLAFSARDFSHY
ncbi:MAG: DUF423 domain-containing protein [Thermodesulfobacteriota bacterium]|nr:DUF423 domain-containing protein [Thermodesulfobacteriota bacterium]